MARFTLHAVLLFAGLLVLAPAQAAPPEVGLGWVLWMTARAGSVRPIWNPHSGYETVRDCETKRDELVSNMVSRGDISLGYGLVERQNSEKNIVQFSCFPSTFDPRNGR
jgi:hypothetical protein